MKNKYLFCMVILGCGMFLTQAFGADTVIKGTTTTSANASLEVVNSADVSLLSVRNDGKVGIGTTTPLTDSGGLDICSGGTTVIGADNNANTRTNATTKRVKIVAPNYTNAEQQTSLFLSTLTGSAATNILHLGGSDSNFNAISNIKFWTAADTITTTGTERMIINSSGNVGIGTTSPAYKLDVRSTTPATITVYGKLTATSGTGHWAGQFENQSTAGTSYGIGGFALGAGTTNIAGYFSASGATNNYGLIVNAGNVGIGTTAPEGLLAFKAKQSSIGKIQFMNNYGNTADAVLDARSTADGTDILLSSNYKLWSDGSTARFNTSEEVAGIHVNKDGTIQFRTNTAGSIAASRMHIQSSGNVGIGTTSPKSKLDVYGELSVTNLGVACFYDVTDGFAGLVGVAKNVVGGSPIDFLGLRGDSGISMFEGTTEVVRIDDGNVGIGTTSPKAKLHSTGSTILGAVGSPVADADLGPGQVNIYVDEANNLLKFKVKYSNGTVKTASVNLQ